jgi:hypothetical protein
MAAQSVPDQTILGELHEVSVQRWGEVLSFIRSLKPQASRPTGEVQSGFTAADLLHSGLVGLRAHRSDLGDSREFARQLREKAQNRRQDS